MLDSWLGFRETVAAQLLFSDCLKRFENTSRKNAITKMFGGNAIITNSNTTKVTTTTKLSGNDIVNKVPIKPAVQMTMSSFLLDSMIVGNIKKKERAAATAAKKKLKEQGESK
jgi:hypothetical protein